METKLKLVQRQKVSIVSVDTDGVETPVKFSDLATVSSNNTDICLAEQDGDDFVLIPVAEGQTQIIVQFVVGSETLTESLDVTVDADSKIVSIKFVLGAVFTKSEEVPE